MTSAEDRAAPGRLWVTVCSALGGVRELKGESAAARVPHRSGDVIAGPHSVAEVDGVGGVHLVPGVVLRGAAGAVDFRAGLLDRAATVPVQAHPEAGYW